MKKIAAVVLFTLPLLVAVPPFVMGHWGYGLASVACAATLAYAMLKTRRSAKVLFIALTVFALLLPVMAVAYDHGFRLDRDTVGQLIVWDLLSAILATMSFAALHLWRQSRTSSTQ